MDITSKLLTGASPYLSSFQYDVLNREITLKFVNDPDNMKCVKEVKIIDVLQYQESDTIEDLDDELIDSVIGIHWMNESTLCIRTETKEAIVKVGKKPYANKIA